MYIAATRDNRPCLRIVVQPKARRTQIVGMHDGMIRLAVASPPVDGKANREVVHFLADLFNLKKNEVRIIAGEHSRRKLCVLGALGEDQIRSRLAPFLAPP